MFELLAYVMFPLWLLNRSLDRGWDWPYRVMPPAAFVIVLAESLMHGNGFISSLGLGLGFSLFFCYYSKREYWAAHIGAMVLTAIITAVQ